MFKRTVLLFVGDAVELNYRQMVAAKWRNLMLCSSRIVHGSQLVQR